MAPGDRIKHPPMPAYALVITTSPCGRVTAPFHLVADHMVRCPNCIGNKRTP